MYTSVAKESETIPLFPGMFGHTIPAEDQVGESCNGKPSHTVRRTLKMHGNLFGSRHSHVLRPPKNHYKVCYLILVFDHPSSLELNGEICGNYRLS